jgi:hypothetical protein
MKRRASPRDLRFFSRCFLSSCVTAIPSCVLELLKGVPSAATRQLRGTTGLTRDPMRSASRPKESLISIYWEISYQKNGAPAWEREPRKARLNASVVFTPARGVIHPSFPLRGRWLRAPETASKPLPPRLQFLVARLLKRAHVSLHCTTSTSVFPGLQSPNSLKTHNLNPCPSRRSDPNEVTQFKMELSTNSFPSLSNSFPSIPVPELGLQKILVSQHYRFFLVPG